MIAWKAYCSDEFTGFYHSYKTGFFFETWDADRIIYAILSYFNCWLCFECKWACVHSDNHISEHTQLAPMLIAFASSLRRSEPTIATRIVLLFKDRKTNHRFYIHYKLYIPRYDYGRSGEG